LLAVLVLGTLAACGDAAPPEAPPNSGMKKSPGGHLVEVAEVATRPLAHETVRTGTLTPRTVVRLFNQEEGRVDAVAAREGDRVTAGRVLVRLDARLLAAELAKATAIRRESETNLARAQELSRRKVTTQERLDKAASDLAVAKAEETLIRTRLDYAEIRAPFDGVVTERLIEPGDVAPRHTHLMTVVDPASLYTSVSVSELLVARLKEGDAAEVSIDALGPKRWPARIKRIHPTVNPRTRQGTVEVDLNPVPPGAAAGQLCRVTLRTPESPRRLMPFAAVRHDREGSFVYVVEDAKAAVKRVRLGLRLGDQVEVLDGLADGDRVIVRGFLDLSAGKAVSIVGGASNGDGR
jgi:RND family efflux transporter MFP subunit